MNASQSIIILLSKALHVIPSIQQRQKKEKTKTLRDKPVYKAILTQNIVEVHIPRSNRTIEQLLDM
jgi:hypothetical protein